MSCGLIGSYLFQNKVKLQQHDGERNALQKRNKSFLRFRLNELDLNELWLLQDGAACHISHALSSATVLLAILKMSIDQSAGTI